MHRLTAAHRRQLLALQAVTLTQLRLLWPRFDPDKPETWARFALPAAVLLRANHGAAQALGTRYYERLREARGVRAQNDTTAPAAGLSDQHVAASLAATGLAGTYLALRRGQPAAAALANGYVRVSRSASRLVLNGSRDAILAASRADASSHGWVRHTGGKPCSWCSARSGVHMTSSEVFQAHDGCSCVAEPEWA